MCTDYHLLSLTTIQAWLVWSTVYAPWSIRCEALNASPSDTAMAVLRRFFAVLLSWQSLPQGTIPLEVVTTTYECLKDVLKVRDKLRSLAKGRCGQFRVVPLTPHKRGGTKRPDKRGLNRGGDTRVAEVPTWVAVTLPDWGAAYGATFGLAHPHNI